MEKAMKHRVKKGQRVCISEGGTYGGHYGVITYLAGTKKPNKGKEQYQFVGYYVQLDGEGREVLVQENRVELEPQP